MPEKCSVEGNVSASGAAGKAVKNGASPGIILIVDDEPDDVLFSRRTIQRLNPQGIVRSVSGGKEMIAYLEGDGPYADRILNPYPDLVLLDLQMPHMDGFEVLSWLSANPAHARLRVVVLSGAGEWRRIEQAYKLGARSFLTKPLSGSDFMTTVRAVSTTGGS